MSQVSENDIHENVKRVVRLTLGSDSAASAPIQQEKTPLSTPVTTGSDPVKDVPAQRVVAIGTDHGGVEMKKILIKDLTEMGYNVFDCGTNSTEPVDYPDIAYAVALLVAQGKAWRGVILDGAGIGSCMAANKVQGIRAALCYDYATAVNSREHNDANVLTLGAGLIGNNLARQILKTGLATEFGGGRHANRVDKIMEIETKPYNDGMRK